MRTVAYKFRAYPDAEQRNIFAQTFGCVRFVYNHMLEHSINQYKRGNKTKFVDWCKELVRLKKEEDKLWLGTPSDVPLQQSIRHLSSGYTNFYKGNARFPKFKKKGNRNSAHFTKNGFKFCEETKTLRIAKMKQPLKVKYTRKSNKHRLEAFHCWHF